MHPKHFICRKLKSELVEELFKVTTRQDKFGNIFFNCEFHVEGSDYPLNYSFTEYSSLIDFIHSNFK